MAPENTLAGFKKALECKPDGIEFDVRVTKDNVPVLVHDEFLLDKNGQKLPIAKTNLKVLRAAKPDLPTLDEALRFLQNKIPLVIEIKPGAYLMPVTDIIRNRLRNGLKPELVTISSFDFNILRNSRGLLPDVGLAVNEKWSGVRATHRARKLGTKYITMNQKWLWSGFIRSMARSGYKLSAYTLNDPAKAKRWAKSGLYAAITDNPSEY